MTTTYININEKAIISGREIIAASVGKFIRIINDNKKTLVKKSAININPYAMYRITYFPEFIKIYPAPEAGVSMTADEYTKIMKEGNEVVNRMFGDLI